MNLFTPTNLLSIATIILILYSMVSILRSKRPAGTNMAWLLLIVSFPYIGIFLYLMLGRRKIPIKLINKNLLFHSRTDEATALNLIGIQRILSVSGMPKSKKNVSIELLTEGENAFSEYLGLIASAKKSIYITTFIFGNDPVAKALIAALTKKAHEGIDVRILVDSLGVLLLRQASLIKFKKSGGKVAYFMPIFHLSYHARFNLRNHRKLLVIDEKIAILGGMNLTKDYMGPKKDAQRWTDIAVKIQGPCVDDLQTIFFQDWAFAVKKPIEHLSSEQNLKPLDSGPSAQVVASGPDVRGDPLYDVLLSSIHSAKDEVQIVTPYFIPDETLAKALELAAKRGVRVKVLVPKKSDHFLADLARGSFIRQLYFAGVEFYFYNEMIHAKVVLIDSTAVILGSANFDMRSLLLNYELGLLIYDESVLQQAKDWLADCMQKASQGHPKKSDTFQISEGIGRLIGPFI